ncbi:hypothetical protein AVEN_47220-1 [Araneus ventricosus]|uniref:Uncharacterized protein n=1 Tax=Araneus ventricosus TaxID=182803 RepID=A0A4Y2W1R3_ARAVE|nr:hypothetical protein AVEN_47220-1 [Araneus ventricosus]
MAAKLIGTRVTRGDADTYIVRCGLQKTTSHPTDTIIKQDVDLVVLLITLASPKSNIYFMKPGKGKIEAKLFSNGNCTNGVFLEEEEFKLYQVVEKSEQIIVENVTNKIESVWAKASTAIPIVTHSRVLQIIHTYHGKHTNFKKSYKRDNPVRLSKKRSKHFDKKYAQSYLTLRSANVLLLKIAHANVLKKLPRNEHNFLKDQRTTRLLYIGSLDINETEKLQNIGDNADRKAHSLYLNHTQATPNAGYVDYEDEEMDCSSDISEEVDLNLDTYKLLTILSEFHVG